MRPSDSPNSNLRCQPLRVDGPFSGIIAASVFRSFEYVFVFQSCRGWLAPTPLLTQMTLSAPCALGVQKGTIRAASASASTGAPCMRGSWIRDLSHHECYCVHVSEFCRLGGRFPWTCRISDGWQRIDGRQCRLCERC